MAVIGNIRKRSGLLIAIVGIALAAFVLGDFFTGERRSVPDVGRIAGEKISYREFEFKVDDYLARVQEQMGDHSFSNEQLFQLRQETWDEMVREILLQKELDAIGITVTVDELYELVQGANPHPYIRQSFTNPETGMFNPQEVAQFIQTLNQREPEVRRQWFMLEQAIKEERLNTKYSNLIQSAYYVPERFAEKDFANRNKAVDLNYIMIPYVHVPDEDVTVDRRALRNAYDKHKYKFYQKEASRSIEYVVFDIAPSREDRMAIEEDLANIYEEFKEADKEDIPYLVNIYSDTRYDSSFFHKQDLPLLFDSLIFYATIGETVGPLQESNVYYIARLMDRQTRPDSVKASHILISHTEAFGASQEITRTKEEAEATADSLLRVVTQQPLRFEELALEFSDDLSVQENAGNLDWFSDGAMIYSFNEACFKGNVGDKVIVETDYGFHVIYITDMLEPQEKVKVAIIERELAPSGTTRQSVYAEASSFSSGLKTTEDFNKAAIEFGKPKRAADDIRAMDNSIPGLIAPREIIRWAFHDDTKLNSVSRIFEVENRYVVATLVDKKEKGIPPLESINEEIEKLALQKLKAEKLIDRINDAKAATSTFEDLAVKVNTNIKPSTNIRFTSSHAPGIGQEPKVIGTAMALEKGILSQPIAGNSGVFVISVTNVYDPPVVQDYSSSKMMLINHFIQRVSFELNNVLKEVYEVEDNRSIFY